MQTRSRTGKGRHPVAVSSVASTRKAEGIGRSSLKHRIMESATCVSGSRTASLARRMGRPGLCPETGRSPLSFQSAPHIPHKGRARVAGSVLHKRKSRGVWRPTRLGNNANG